MKGVDLGCTQISIFKNNFYILLHYEFVEIAKASILRIFSSGIEHSILHDPLWWQVIRFIQGPLFQPAGYFIIICI